MATQADPQPQTQTQPGDKKPDRTLSISCKPTLHFESDTVPYKITATVEFYYNAEGSNPSMEGRVHPDGDIILHPLPDADAFSNRVDIWVNLDTTAMVDPQGHAVDGRWAYENEYSGTGPVTGFCWFCRVQDVSRRDYDKTPVEVNGMSATRTGDTQIFIDDNAPAASPAVAFCLGLVLPQFDNYYLTIDPVITSKSGVGNNPPM